MKMLLFNFCDGLHYFFHITLLMTRLEMLNNRRREHKEMASRGIVLLRRNIYIFLQILQILQCLHAVIACSKYDLILIKVIQVVIRWLLGWTALSYSKYDLDWVHISMMCNHDHIHIGINSVSRLAFFSPREISEETQRKNIRRKYAFHKVLISSHEINQNLITAV